MGLNGSSVVLVLKVGYAMISVNTHTLTGLIAYLVRDGLLDQITAEEAFNKARQQKTSITHYLVSTRILSSQIILECCAKNFSLPVFNLKNYNLNEFQSSIINAELISRYRVLPIQIHSDFLQLGVTDPTDDNVISAISFHTGLRIHPMLVAEDELNTIINKYFRTNIYSQLETALSKITLIEEQTPTYENQTQDDEPVIQFVDHLINDAIEKQVSDIHIEPYENHCRIRFRHDGLLFEAATLPPHLYTRVITRLKVMTNLNIAERRIPQDGHLELCYKTKTDIRVSTCPTLFGEKIVLRILNMVTNLNIGSLGFTQAQEKLFLNKLTLPQGLILVTGPTGSGKTITLYSALQYLNQTEKNISSVEDPVEIKLKGINQVNVNSKIGLNFATVLRALLRQDPDIIMIGEIRDNETATIAMQAAQTGHLVLSTLHANSAIEAITRLQAMGIVAHHFINSLSLIIAQRLMRKLCSYCKQPEHPHTTYKAKGCEHCHQGYQGRIAIFELLPITETIMQIILSNSPISNTIQHAKNEKWSFLWDAGMEKVHTGMTTLVELRRVVEQP